jgi:fumarylacetoacetate (FAA) hydrolase
MKLASLKSGRDGQLVVVSRNLSHAVTVADIASTMQQALDNWPIASQALLERYGELNSGQLSDAFKFESAACDAPLPRAYHWADGSAYGCLGRFYWCQGRHRS